MTPGVKVVKRAGVDFKLHQYEHDSQSKSYGLEAAEMLNLPVERVFKTLVLKLSTGRLAVAVLPVGEQLNLKRFASAVGDKKVAMADPQEVERSSGYVLGGVSPIGQKKALPTVLDDSAQACETIFVSGGRRGLEIELQANDLLPLVRGKFAAIT
ncbi:Cys-tRNA(Pro)/Cys-tRNA(Cys) deacylase [Sinobacterium caligoides]|uniref:Cys-tRNA(Pro)/Cys-tRNA(Cys) deacylase n=1 Tax=Sinobacterium caligoides TaxID=933926 RepID=A0A3N2DJX6_9GAMM|nr:Cys-tRNA(Pro) deacylase [Sinobacterium caligoides]ROS00103.1 Cys-tRNA(Pro)/Cys-tRNA(Cys) deacylase [Sinobacterium caligoides]